jgi:hypothetical protein
MFAILPSLGMFIAELFKSRWRVEAENLFPRHRLNIALRRAPPRLRLRGSDRVLLVWIKRIQPGPLDVTQVVQPETIQSTMWSAPNPWRTADARVRGRSIYSLQIHGATSEATFAIGDNISSNSR